MRQAEAGFDDLVGIPFIDGGRDAKNGLDCWGLFMEAQKRFGNHVPDYKISCFATDQIGRTTQKALQEQWARVDGPAPGRGVVLEIDPERPGWIQHFGVCISKYRFIHTLEKSGSIISEINDRYWKRKIKGYYEWRK